MGYLLPIPDRKPFTAKGLGIGGGALRQKIAAQSFIC